MIKKLYISGSHMKYKITIYFSKIALRMKVNSVGNVRRNRKVGNESNNCFIDFKLILILSYYSILHRNN